MANTLYNESRRLFLEAGINWDTDNIKAMLIDTGEYNFSASHQNLNDVASIARITPGVTLSTTTTAEGAADADDVTFSAVSGPSIEAILIYRDTGTESTSTLIAWLDTATGLPITPNGGDIIVTWDNGVNRIFRL